MHTDSNKLPKLIVLVGPTASGKTKWSLELGKIFGGEIISADSRQIYKKMNIGTAKPAGEWRRNGLRKTYYIEDIPHHNIDFLDPGRRFSAAEFRDRAVKYAKLAYRERRLPMLVGGTGLYVQAVVDNLRIPRVLPNHKLRKSFESKSIEELTLLLRSLDPSSAETMDVNNKRRLIRALEVCIMTGEPFSMQKRRGEPLFDILQVGISVPRDVMDARIEERVDTMIKLGLVEEIRHLLSRHYTWTLPSLSAIGYRQFKEYFEGKQTLDDAIERLKRDTRKYARRQIAWFKRDTRIKWCEDVEQAKSLAQKFLSE